MYSVGHLENPKEKDERFESEFEATQAAIKGSCDDNVWAVWRDEDSEVLAVIYMGIAYH